MVIKKSIAKTVFACSLLTAGVGANAQTQYNGDKVGGIPVITKLDVNDLEAGKRHDFYFQSSQQSLGQSWYVPVIVIKGASDGKKILLNTGVHGNELNGLQVIHDVIKEIDPQKLSGTLVAIPASNPAGTLSATRTIPVRDDNDMKTNLNRVFPGEENGNIAQRHAWLLWNNLYAGNADYVYDLHSNIILGQFPVFVYADYSNAEVRRMAEMIPADMIDTDQQGTKGTLETEFVRAGIPAITLEIGEARQFGQDYVKRSVIGIHNMMIDLKMLEGTITQTAETQKSFVGNTIYDYQARASGVIVPFVKLGDKVKAGQVIVVQKDIFGKVVHEYKSEADGVIAALTTDALRNYGNYLFFVLTQRDDAECEKGCWLTR